jgi:hypothetical protein
MLRDISRLRFLRCTDRWISYVHVKLQLKRPYTEYKKITVSAHSLCFSRTAVQTRNEPFFGLILTYTALSGVDALFTP